MDKKKPIITPFYLLAAIIITFIYLGLDYFSAPFHDLVKTNKNNALFLVLLALVFALPAGVILFFYQSYIENRPGMAIRGIYLLFASGAVWIGFAFKFVENNLLMIVVGIAMLAGVLASPFYLKKEDDPAGIR